jgi:hypothetical protein
MHFSSRTSGGANSRPRSFTEEGKFSDLIENLVATTDRLIVGSRGSTQAGAQGSKQRLGAVPLAWSRAVRVNHGIIIEALIAYAVSFPPLALLITSFPRVGRSSEIHY